jgi:hypothetical protein
MLAEVLPGAPARDVPQDAQNRVPARFCALQAGLGQTTWSADRGGIGVVAGCVMARVPESSANDEESDMAKSVSGFCLEYRVKTKA